MKPIRVLALLAVSIAPHWAFAADTTLPAGLGQTKAILDYCTQVDPADAAIFAQMWAVTSGNPKLQTAAGFQDNYNSVMATLKSLEGHDLSKGCQAGASDWRSHKPHGEKDDDKKPSSARRE